MKAREEGRGREKGKRGIRKDKEKKKEGGRG